MDSQTDGLFISRLIRELNPDIFQHPVWVQFASNPHRFEPAWFQLLFQSAQQLQAERDYSSACDLLYLCAAQDCRWNDPLAALQYIDQVLKIARRHRLFLREAWGYWGAGAVCAQQGDYYRSGRFLQLLQTLLRNSGEWVMADFVEMTCQSVEKLAETGERTAGSGSDPFLQSVLEAMLSWGEAPLQPGSIRRAFIEEPSLQSGRSWGSAWTRLKLFLARKRPEPRTKVSNTMEKIAPSTASQIQTPGNGIPVTSPPPGIDQGPAPGSAAVESVAAEQERSAAPVHPAIQEPLPAGRPPLLSPAPAEQGSSLAVYCLGPFKVFLNNQIITGWNGQKGTAILKYMVANRERPVAKDILMDLFWPDADAEVARRNLHQAIYALRQALRRALPELQLILFENDRYRLNAEVDIWLDFEEFERFVKAGQAQADAGRMVEAMEAYGIAEELYGGDFLEEDLYDDWPQSQREYLRTLYLEIAAKISAYYIQKRQVTPAMILCQKVLARDRCNEQAYRGLIQCYLIQDQRQLAIREYQVCVQVLKDELGLPPSEETRELYRRIAEG